MKAMFASTVLPSLAFGRSLFVANYAGPVVHLSLTDSGGNYSLEQVSSTLDCGFNPGWLEIDQSTDSLICLNEAYTLLNSGSISSFSKDTLSIIDNVTSDYGPAASTFYAPHRLALAHYAGGAVSVFDTSDVNILIEIQSFHYTMSTPGPNSTLQDKPYPHGIISDPTGKFVVALDRGADLLRTYSVGWDDRLVELGAYATEPGNGPRHGVFVKGKEKTFIYILGELTNSLHGFEVLYEPNNGIGFRQFYNDSTFQTGFGDGSGVAVPSEIALPEPYHLIVSVRNDNRQKYQGRDSDTLITYKVDPDTGGLSLVGMSASGGRWPRSFAVSKDGTLIAVGNQYSIPGTLYVFLRDRETGIIDDSRAIAEWTTYVALPDGGSISNIIWGD